MIYGYDGEINKAHDFLQLKEPFTEADLRTVNIGLPVPLTQTEDSKEKLKHIIILLGIISLNQKQTANKNRKIRSENCVLGSSEKE